MTHGQTTFNNGFNLKTEIQKEIDKHNFKLLPKLIHHIESPYQKRRFKAEFVGQEVWIYRKKIGDMFGVLISQEDWQNEDYKPVVIADLIHTISINQK
jgi:hypothetical protein